MSKTALVWLAILGAFFIWIGFASFTNWLHSHNAPPAAQPTNEPPVTPQKIPPPNWVKLDIRDGDPHYCDKPDDAWYKPTHPDRPGRYDYNQPRLLFTTKNQTSDGTIKWANGFKGTVMACFIVGKDGVPQDITFPVKPRDDIAEHITDIINAYRFSPAMYNGEYLKTLSELNFTFP